MDTSENYNAAAQAFQEESAAAASIALDALMMAGIVQPADEARALAILTEEILVRKAMGKL